MGDGILLPQPGSSARLPTYSRPTSLQPSSPAAREGTWLGALWRGLGRPRLVGGHWEFLESTLAVHVLVGSYVVVQADLDRPICGHDLINSAPVNAGAIANIEPVLHFVRELVALPGNVPVQESTNILQVGAVVVQIPVELPRHCLLDVGYLGVKADVRRDRGVPILILRAREYVHGSLITDEATQTTLTSQD